jgi:hypothetical protein
MSRRVLRIRRSLGRGEQALVRRIEPGLASPESAHLAPMGRGIAAGIAAAQASPTPRIDGVRPQPACELEPSIGFIPPQKCLGDRIGLSRLSVSADAAIRDRGTNAGTAATDPAVRQRTLGVGRKRLAVRDNDASAICAKCPATAVHAARSTVRRVGSDVHAPAAAANEIRRGTPVATRAAVGSRRAIGIGTRPLCDRPEQANDECEAKPSNRHGHGW